MFKIGVTELVLILIIALVFFGGKNLPGIGKAIGGTMREFRNAMSPSSEAEKMAERKESGSDQAKK